MIVEDTKTGTARPRRSLRVSHTRVAHASGSLRPACAPQSLHEIGLFWRAQIAKFSRCAAQPWWAAQRLGPSAEVGLGRFSKYSMFLRHLLGFRVSLPTTRTGRDMRNWPHPRLTDDGRLSDEVGRQEQNGYQRRLRNEQSQSRGPVVDRVTHHASALRSECNASLHPVRSALGRVLRVSSAIPRRLRG